MFLAFCRTSQINEHGCRNGSAGTPCGTHAASTAARQHGGCDTTDSFPDSYYGHVRAPGRARRQAPGSECVWFVRVRLLAQVGGGCASAGCAWTGKARMRERWRTPVCAGRSPHGRRGNAGPAGMCVRARSSRRIAAGHARIRPTRGREGYSPARCALRQTRLIRRGRGRAGGTTTCRARRGSWARQTCPCRRR